MAGTIEVRQASVGSFDNNVYVLVDGETNESVLIDAPTEPETIQRLTDGTTVKYILMTHGDADHVQALIEMKKRLEVPVAVHDDDARHLPIPPDMSIHEGDVFQFGNSSLRAVHTPGHTAGSVSFIADGILISGDTLFPGGPGNTQRPGGDFEAIISGIREKLFTLPDDTKVYPGHGASTTIGTEKPHLNEWIDRGY